jgi:hypothetical protein
LEMGTRPGFPLNGGRGKPTPSMRRSRRRRLPSASANQPLSGTWAYAGSMWPSIRRAVSWATILVVAGAGCDFVNRCTVESRAAEYRTEATSGSGVGLAALELSQTRGAEHRDWLLWHVRVTPWMGTPVAVLVREGRPEAPGRTLFELPVLNTVPDSGVVTQVFVRTAYAGSVPFAELWDIIQSRPVTVEILFGASRQPVRLGPLLPAGSSDWQETCS